MNVLFLTLLHIAGAFARSAVQAHILVEGPQCPIADPLESPGPVDINVNLNPLAELVGSERGDLEATGLSTLSYNINIAFITLVASFEVRLETVRASTTYTAHGYVDARPLDETTIPRGNFTGRGLANILATGVHVKGQGSLSSNTFGNKASLVRLTLQIVSFDSLSVDLGPDFNIGGNTVDWAAWSANIKANFDRDFREKRIGITDKIRLAANNIIGQYTLAELNDIIESDFGRTCEPSAALQFSKPQFHGLLNISIPFFKSFFDLTS